MKQIELAPIQSEDKAFDQILAAISRAFRDELYLPLLRIVMDVHGEKLTLQNAAGGVIDDLLLALRQGKIRHVRGYFEGSINARLSAQIKASGGVWSTKFKRWGLPARKLTPEMKHAIDGSITRFQAMADAVNKRLDEVSPEALAGKIDIEKIVDQAIWKVGKTINAQLKAVSIHVNLSDEQRKRLVAEYSRNLQLDIKNWTDREVIDLRKRITAHASDGSRYEAMIETIQSSYGVSRSKAKFLARQETNLLMTKYAQARYQDAGVNKYRWRCVNGSPNHPVRPMHKALDGQIFSWDNPPVVNEKGDKKNAGQDYGCRCRAIPIVNFRE